MNPTPIVVTAIDEQRLLQIIEDSFAGKDRVAAEELELELARASVVPPRSIAPDVVTMNSRLLYRDEDSGTEREVTLVYPQDADASRRRISVLSAVGTALLGLSVGQGIAWTLPGGARRRLRVLEIRYQPEAAGDFHL